MIKWLLLFSAWSFQAWSFPEMIRHGYTQCTACHISPAGGGILSSYGRQLAAELLSTWSYENESQFLHSSVGAKMAEKGFLFGGDVRAIQTRRKDSSQLDGKFFLMNADLQSAYQTEKFTGVVSVGQVTNPMSGHVEGNFDATEYYGYLKFSDEIGLRAGRFLPAYGINNPDHTVIVKSHLGFSPGLQFDSAEASYLSDHWTVLATAARTVDNTPRSEQETARSVNVSYALLNRMRVGASYWAGEGFQLDRHMYGVNAILGFTSHFYNLTEIDFENQSRQDGAFVLSQLAYEVFQGLTPYLQFQQSQDSLVDRNTLIRMYGAGFHFYPRPHFEFSGEWDRVKSVAAWSDSGWVQAHYYF